MSRRGAVRGTVRGVVSLGAWLLWLSLPILVAAAEVSTSARLLPSGEGIELAYRSGDESWTELIPIYRVDSADGAIRYFSTGISVDQRQAAYPSYPLKVVLTAGNRAYAAHADVQIVSAEGGKLTLSIPSDHVQGPWLFVDLPPGRYDVTGTGVSGAATPLRVTVTAERQLVVHLRFPPDRNP